MGGAGKGKGKGKGKAPGKGKAAGKGKGTWTAKGEATSPAKGAGKGKGKWVEIKPTVLVTGVAGYVATSIVRRLINAHYRVRGTVRSLEDEKKVAPLKRLFPSLELVEADLLGGSEAFEKAAEGCKYIIHVASPVTFESTDVQKDVIDPAVKGTEAVIQAAIKVGVSRVVLTSSIVTVGPSWEVLMGKKEGDKEKVYTEEDWNLEDTVETEAYTVSKVKAEQRAWELVKGVENLSLVTILPSFVVGPPMLNRADSHSISWMKGLLDGTKKEKCEAWPAFGVVDVRDVSLAHVTALEIPEAAGKRFILSSENGHSLIELAGLIRDRFKAYPIPTEGAEPAYIPKYNNSQAKEVLKFDPRPIEVTLADMANAVLRLGITDRKFVLKPVKFSEVGKVFPDSRGVDLLVKVMEVKAMEETKNGISVTEAIVGDKSGVVTLRLFGDEAADVKEGAIVEVRNAAVKMLNGFIRLQVGKWGKVNKYAAEADIKPNPEKDVSATEYELVLA